ncbi:hypothetical protein ACQ4M3_25700 [Leptolyngbya sp. AN03gr2]|uniref:hypothetical protein n=1 Tax=unclassified Leptolyngbya TaxID=2650499 RepID=UPI003D314DA9
MALRKLSLLLTSTLLTLTALSTLPALSQTLEKSNQSIPSSERIALNLPNFQPKASFSNGVLQVAIPVSLLEGPFNDILRANEGRYKDTDFQRMDVSSMRVSFADGGFTVNGNWQFQAREYLGSVFGRKRYTSWTSISGSFSQGFNVRVNNGVLVAQAGKTNIRGANKWYGDILNAVISRVGVNGTVNKQVNQNLQRINGMNVQQLLVSAGSDQAAQALGISRDEAIRLINARVGGANAGISGGNLNLTVKVQ